MELLDLFEERIQALIAEVQNLRKDNDELRKELSSYVDLVEQHNKLNHELSKSKENAEIVHGRIQALLDKIQNVVSE